MTRIGELNGPSPSYILTNTDAALAKDAEVIIADEERAIFPNRQFLGDIGRGLIQANVVNRSLQLAVAIPWTENAALCHRHMAQTDIKGETPFSSMTVEAGIRMPGKNLLQAIPPHLLQLGSTSQHRHSVSNRGDAS